MSLRRCLNGEQGGGGKQKNNTTQHSPHLPKNPPRHHGHFGEKNWGNGYKPTPLPQCTALPSPKSDSFHLNAR